MKLASDKAEYKDGGRIRRERQRIRSKRMGEMEGREKEEPRLTGHATLYMAATSLIYRDDIAIRSSSSSFVFS